MNMFRELTKQETTIIRREFNKWGIYNYIHDKEFVIKANQSNNNKDLCLKY